MKPEKTLMEVRSDSDVQIDKRADISTPEFSSPAILTVPHFPLPYFQHPHNNYNK